MKLTQQIKEIFKKGLLMFTMAATIGATTLSVAGCDHDGGGGGGGEQAIYNGLESDTVQLEITAIPNVDTNKNTIAGSQSTVNSCLKSFRNQLTNQANALRYFGAHADAAFVTDVQALEN